MADKEQRLPVERDLRPAYYDDFHCLAEKCRYSCCKEWKITFSKRDYLSLKRESGSQDLNNKLAEGLRRVRNPKSDTEYGEFNMDSSVCPLLQEDGLCQLQIERGHSALPDVCRTYPRWEKYMSSGYLEKALSPSCEAVLALLWDLPEGIDFYSDPLPKEQHRCLIFEPQDPPLQLWFSVVREWCVDRLQDRRFSLPERIFLMGLGLKELAEGETDITHWMERAMLLPETTADKNFLPADDSSLRLFLLNHARTLLGSLGRGEFQRIREELLTCLNLQINPKAPQNIRISPQTYLDARERYEERFGDRAYFMENLAVAVFHYFQFPKMSSPEELWKSYVSFCNVSSFFRFLAVMSCREGVEEPQEELFRLLSQGSRALLHNNARQSFLRDELFQNDSSDLAHMAILLCG